MSWGYQLSWRMLMSGVENVHVGVPGVLPSPRHPCLARELPHPLK